MRTKNITISLAVNIFKDGKRYIADCPALALATHGGSLREVQRHFEDALNVWMKNTMREGVLKKALLELGWTLGPVPMPEEADYSKVPVCLLKQKYYPITIPGMSKH